MKRKRLCIVATVPFALIVFMMPHVFVLSEKYDVTLIANGQESDVKLLLGENVKFIPIAIERKIAILRDIYILLQLYRIFRQNRFDVVHSLMPKAGLLAMLASFFSGVPIRIHTFTGQVWANKSGIGRLVLKALDKITVLCATSLLTDSFSQSNFLIAQNIVHKEKISVLGHGSVCGVDITRFKSNLIARNSIRSSLGIPDDAIVFLYLGRLNRDKGIQDLASAFCLLADEIPKTHLMVVGPDEGGMAIELHKILNKYSHRFHLVGFTDKPEDYMASADIFCLQSYREGFGSVIVEAAAVGLPAIASNIYGITDAIVDGETGILHEAGNVEEIGFALRALSMSEDIRREMAQKAKSRVHQYFTTDIVKQEMRKFYEKLLN